MEEIVAVFILSGPEVEPREVLVGRGDLITVGRTAKNSIPLNHPQISREHLTIAWGEDAPYVQDNNSRNGVKVNGERIDPEGRQRLYVGNWIEFGPFSLRYERNTAGVVGDVASSSLGGVAASAGTRAEASPVARRPGVEEVVSPPRPATSRGSNGLTPGPQSGSRLNEHLLSPARRDPQRYGELPTERSTWLQYLPAIFSDPIIDFNGFNHNDFIGRYLMIFETVLNPVVWLIDNFDLYLSARTAPESWLAWLASWFDVWLIPELPEARKRQIVEQLGWLYLRRGTAMGLSRFLELYFGVPVDIVEFDDSPCTFTVRIPLAHSDLPLTSAQKHDLAVQLVDGQKPAFTRFQVEDISASI